MSSFSFQYPADWNVDDYSTPGIFNVVAPSGLDRISVTPLPVVRDKSPTDYAGQIVAAMRSNLPDLRASMLEADAVRAYFELVYTQVVTGCPPAVELLQKQVTTLPVFSIRARPPSTTDREQVN